jgi:hypothetical protein
MTVSPARPAQPAHRNDDDDGEDNPVEVVEDATGQELQVGRHSRRWIEPMIRFQSSRGSPMSGIQ